MNKTLKQANRGVRVLYSFLIPFKAISFILCHPTLWPMCLLPVIINVIAVYFTWKYTKGFIDHKTALMIDAITIHWISTTLHWVFTVLNVIFALIASIIASVFVGNLATIPFNDFLSERTEILNHSWKNDSSFSMSVFIRQTFVLLWQEMIRIFIFGFVSMALLIMSLLPGICLLSFPAIWISGCYYLSFDYFAYPLERRGILNFRHKVDWMNQHVDYFIGFGSTMNLFAMVPLVRYLFIPIGVVGAALLFGERKDDSDI